MKKAVSLFVSILLLFIASVALGQKAGSSTVLNRRAFVKISNKTENPITFEFSTSGYRYTLADNGHGKRSIGSSKIVAFNLNLAKDEFLDGSGYYAEYEGDLLVAIGTSFGDGGAGFIARLDGKTLKLKWKRHIPAFNIGRGLLDGNYAYVTAIGFVGKVNLSTGAYAWQHGNLYGEKNSAFNSFELPEITGKKVTFTESENYLRKTRASLEVDIRRGKILRITRE